MADNNNPTNGEQDEEKRRKNQMSFIVEQQARIDANLASITERLDRLTQNVDVFVVETREAINNLIIANEGTRELAQQAAQLAVQTSRRVSDLEKN